MLFSTSLKKNHEFRLVYNKGRSSANKYLVLYALRNGTASNRVGISVSKKVGKSVIRSHKMRLVRESYRLLESNLSSGYDLIFIVRVNAKDCNFHQINKAAYGLLKKLGVLNLPY